MKKRKECFHAQLAIKRTRHDPPAFQIPENNSNCVFSTFPQQYEVLFVDDLNSVLSLTTLGASILSSYKGGDRGVRSPVQVRTQVWSTFQPGAFCSVHSDCTCLKQTMAKYQKKTSLEVSIYLPGQSIRLRHVSPIKMKSYHVGSLGSGSPFSKAVHFTCIISLNPGNGLMG